MLFRPAAAAAKALAWVAVSPDLEHQQGRYGNLDIVERSECWEVGVGGCGVWYGNFDIIVRRLLDPVAKAAGQVGMSE